MTNPNGPYPGRQLFLGITAGGNPALAYLVTGRSPESRDRAAIRVDNTVRIGPTGDVQYDPLRHYTAIKYDDRSGVTTVSNGIQTEAIFEAYRLLFNTSSAPGKQYVETLLEGAGAEPDSYHTPRIAGTVTYLANGGPIFIIGIKGHGAPAAATVVEPKPGTMSGVSTYQGPMDSPLATSPEVSLPTIEFPEKTAKELAKYVYDMSAATYKGDDIRVCAVGGIYDRKNHRWDFAIINRHQTK